MLSVSISHKPIITRICEPRDPKLIVPLATPTECLENIGDAGEKSALADAIFADDNRYPRLQSRDVRLLREFDI
jgi:hypothetical protein